MIEVIELTKHFGTKAAVRGVSFRVEAGEAVGFLGPNGAGKTTTFRMIAGTIGPTSGRVRLHGRELEEDPIAAKRGLGYMPENPPLYPELTVQEYLDYRAELKGIPRSMRRAAWEKAIGQVDVKSVLGRRIGHLSKGYRQRVALADALLGSPPVLLLDEPTSGLDPNQVLDVRALIRELAKTHAILLSTHVLSEVEATCSRAIVIFEGLIVTEAALDDLKSTRHVQKARLVTTGTEETLRRIVGENLQDLAQLSDSKWEFVARLDDGADDLAPIVRRLIEENVQVFEANLVRSALDEVFATVTRKSERTEKRGEERADS